MKAFRLPLERPLASGALINAAHTGAADWNSPAAPEAFRLPLQRAVSSRVRTSAARTSAPGRNPPASRSQQNLHGQEAPMKALRQWLPPAVTVMSAAGRHP